MVAWVWAHGRAVRFGFLLVTFTLLLLLYCVSVTYYYYYYYYYHCYYYCYCYSVTVTVTLLLLLLRCYCYCYCYCYVVQLFRDTERGGERKKYCNIAIGSNSNSNSIVDCGYVLRSLRSYPPTLMLQYSNDPPYNKIATIPSVSHN